MPKDIGFSRSIESRYRALFDNMIDGFAFHEIVLDEAGEPVDYIFLEVNQAFEDLTGLKRDDVLGRGVREVIPGIEEDPADWIGTYGDVALKGTVARFEQYAEALDRWFEVSAYSPQEGFFATVFEDITGRKQAEEALLHSEERLSSANELIDAHLQNSPLAVVEFDSDFRVTGWRGEAEKMFGWQADEVVGKMITELRWVHEDDKQLVEREFAGLFNGTTPSHVNINRNYRKDGSALWCEWYYSAIYDDQGYLVSVFSQVLDITERKQTENIFNARFEMLEKIDKAPLIDAMRMALDVIERETGSTIGFYHFVNDDQRTLELQTWSTNTIREMCKAEGSGSHYDISAAGVWVDCVREGKPVIHNDYASLPNRKGLPEGHAPVTKELVVPIYREDRIVAIVGVGNKEQNYDEADIRTASLLAEFSWEIIERKRAEEEIQHLASFPDLNPNPVIEMKGVDVIIYMNKATSTTLRELGLDEGDARPFIPADIEEIAARMGDSEAGEATVFYRDVDINGRIYSESVHVTPEFQTVRIYAHDITRRRQAEDKLREAMAAARIRREEMEVVLENAPEAGLVHLDRDFNFLMVNSTFARMCRRAREDFSGRNYFDLYPGAVEEAVFKSVRDTGEAADFIEEPFEFPDQPERSVLYLDRSLTPVKDSEGAVDSLVLSLVDVTDKVRERRYSEALNDINDLINSTLDFSERIKLVVTGAMKVMEADTAFFALLEGDELLVRDSRNSMIEPGARLEMDALSSLMPTLETGDPVFVSDTRKDNRVDRKRTRRLGIAAGIVIPLKSSGGLSGFLSVDYRKRREFTRQEVDFVHKLANSMSLALDNARLYESEQMNRAHIQDYANRMSILHDIGLSLNRETDRDKLLKGILAGAARLTSAGVGALLLVEQDKTNLVALHYASWYKDRCQIDSDATSLHERISRFVTDRARNVIAVPDFDSGARGNEMPEGHMPLRGLLVGALRDIRGRDRGYFVLSDKAGGTDFTREDESIISLLATQSSVALTSIENLEREHVVAETLQSSLLPSPPERSDMDVGLLYRSAAAAARIGGDYYDFIELDDRRVAVVVADVCGKGLDAAAYTAMVKYTLRTYLQEESDPGRCLTKLNASLSREMDPEKFVTLTLAIIDCGKRVITYALAGHPAPMCYNIGQSGPEAAGEQSGSPVTQLESLNTLPLGVLRDYEFRSLREHLGPDATILLFTDGLSEARGEDGQPFGFERLASEFASLIDLKAQVLAQELMNRVVSYSAGGLDDDVALVVLQLNG